MLNLFMKNKPLIYKIFILLFVCELLTVLLIFLTIKNTLTLTSALHKTVVIFSFCIISLAIAVEVARDVLLNKPVVLKEYFDTRFRIRRQLKTIGIAKLKQRYTGAALGWAWAILRPAINIFIYWFAISMGFRAARDIDGCPYFLWLIAGFIPWFYMRDMITYGAGCYRNNMFLMKVAKFPIITIPTITNISLIPVHLGLLVIMVVIFLISGYGISIYIIQLPIYMLMMFVFFDFWGLFAGVLSAVSKDFLNLVNSFVIALFWISGILYDLNGIDSRVLRFIFSFNPITSIISGYRHCFVDRTWFFEDGTALVNYFLMLLVMIYLAIRAYKRFEKMLQDVL